MKIRGYVRLFLAMSIAALSLPLSAATPELDPLAGEVAAYLAAGAHDPAASLQLAMRIGWSEKTASFEKNAAQRAELLGRLAGMRRELAAAGRLSVGKAFGSAVEANGAITGRVTEDGAPVTGTRISIHAQAGYYLESVYTGADGRYAIDMPPGTYYAYAEPPWGVGLSPQLFDGISCVLSSTCQLGQGTPLALISGGHRVADFALADLGAISGEVRRFDNLQPVATEVLIFAEENSYTGDTYVENDGSYRLSGLPPGDYLVVAQSAGELAGMIYDGVSCNQRRYDYGLRCPTLDATVVTVGLDQEVAGIDFQLRVGGRLAGRIADARNGLPISGSSDVVVWDSAYRQVDRSYFSNPDGSYLIEGLAGGTYYLSVERNDTTSQYYDRFDCIPGAHCLLGARPVELALGGLRGGLDFSIRQHGTVSGRVTDEVTGGGIEAVSLTLSDPATGFEVESRYSDSAGFFSFSGMPAVGLVLEARHNEYRGEYYDDVDARLGPAAATVIVVRPGEVIGNLEIELEPRGSLTVQAVAKESGTPLSGFRGVLLKADGTEVAYERAWGPDAKLLLENLEPGRYYFMAGDYARAHYLYGKGSCNLVPDRYLCDLAEGVPFEVRSGQTTDLGQIQLEAEAGFTARGFFDPPSGDPVPSVFLQLYDADGNEVQWQQFSIFGTEAYFNGLAPGTYRLVARGGSLWNSVAYPDVPCGRWYCDPLDAEPFVLEAGAPGPDREFHFTPIAPYAGCTPGDNALCLNQGRYRVTATWRDFAGAAGAGVARSLTPDSGYFYFFSPNNIEVLVKALNGCERRLGHHFWFYGAGLTNVQVELRVADTLTGAVEIYTNSLGQTFQPILDNQAFATCDAVEPPAPPAATPAPAVVAAAPEPATSATSVSVAVSRWKPATRPFPATPAPPRAGESRRTPRSSTSSTFPISSWWSRSSMAAAPICPATGFSPPA